MSASPSCRIQVNFKSGEGFDATLVNVYAENDTELGTLLEAVKHFAPQIAEARGAVAIAHGVKVGEVFPDPTPSPRDNAQAFVQQQQPQQGPPQGFNPGAPSCVHGQRTFREGTGKTGKPYKMWACPSKDRSSQCDAQWVN